MNMPHPQPGDSRCVGISRRRILGMFATAGVLEAVGGVDLAWAQDVREPSAATSRPAQPQRYRIAAADWMMLKRQKPGALKLARDCGLDGVELDMGPLGTRPDFENELLKDEFRNSYLDSAKALGLEICSLAMSAFYGQSFSKHSSAQQFAKECIELMPRVGTKTAFIPVMTRADMKHPDAEADAKVQQAVVELFKQVGPMAETAGVVIGISTQLDSAGNNRLLDQIGSPAIRIAYNIGEAVDDGRDPYKELRELGRDRISEVVPTLSDGVLLAEDRRLDLRRLKNALDETGWQGWLVLQRSRDAKRARDVKYNFSANAQYLKSIFQT